ncbi:hypothetical protein ACINWC743_1586 [Acinetobacter sp. WC-743]|uniref:hypothetical protein n=1 Tax=Acinetobacter sp. WC-743 TaxID=903945 RepID=UPI0002AE92C6|nr:hypothetical protein [Acinetobacter sp. WC-743]ELW81987.1 hypothetical protein ACINWC743_1586 [Acinetobacter sp. WC-743]
MPGIIDLADVERDIADIGKTVNEDTIVNPRSGSDYDSLPKVVREAKANMETATETIVASTEIKSTEFMNDLATRYLALSLKGDWQAATAYVVKDLVFVENITYICLVGHTSSSNFQNDLNAGKWFVYQGATQVDLQNYLPKTAEFSPVLGSPVRFKLNPIMASFLYGISDPIHKDDELNNFRGLNNQNAWHESNIGIGGFAVGRNNVPFAYLSNAFGHDCVAYGVASMVGGAGSATGNPDDPNESTGKYGYCGFVWGKNTLGPGRISNAMGELCKAISKLSSVNGYKAIAGPALPDHPDYLPDGAEGVAARAYGYEVEAFGNFAVAMGAFLKAFNGAMLIGKGAITEKGIFELILSKRGVGIGYNVDLPTIFCKEGPGVEGAHAWVGFNTDNPVSKYDHRLEQSDTVSYTIDAQGSNSTLVAFEVKGLLANGKYGSLHNVIVTHTNAGQPYGIVQYRLNGQEYLTVDQTRIPKFTKEVESLLGFMVAGDRVIGGQMPAIADLPSTATLEDVIAKVNVLLASLREESGHGLIAK